MNEIQEPPFAIQVELTEGCNLRCAFCGLNGIREPGKNDLKFLTVDLARRLVQLIKWAGWNPRIEFAMHGEPSLNPDMVEILGVFRRGLPRRTHLMMTSNGGGFVKDPTATIDACLRSLNVLALDWYQNVQLVPKILERYKGAHTPAHYPQDPAANPHRRRKPGEHHLVIIQDIAAATTGTHSTLNNHCGAGAPKDYGKMGARCAKPFRELSIRWNGAVAVCCNDWRGEYRCGDLNAQTLDEVWNGPAMRAARRKLYHGLRDFGPCHGCNAVSYRVGLLPDKKGQSVLPRPTPEDLRAIRVATAGKSLTLPVLRPWECG